LRELLDKVKLRLRRLSREDVQMVCWRKLIVIGAGIATLGAPAGALAASTVAYSYDVFGQLVTVNSTAGRSVSYTYDTAGNRTNMTATGTTALNTPSKAPLAADRRAGINLAQAGQAAQARRAVRAR
jgi:YD repeat-containing protein